MKDIIIVGMSKAGSLHIKAYNEMINRGNLYYVDISEKINNKNIRTQKVYKYIKDVLIDNNIDSKNVIVDICVPKEEFYNIISQCIELKIYDIIVEKPFVASRNFFTRNKELNLIMIQNYLYSDITKDIVKFIKDNQLTIKMITTDFSKNRIIDSKNNRGFVKKVTQNFEIEIPHQIYLADYILNSDEKIDVLYKEQKDFKHEGVVLKKHGYGKVIMKQNNTLIVHESDLMTNNIRKEISTICNNNIFINAKYLLYDNDLNKKQNGKLVINNSNRKLIEKDYTIDNNIYNCLSEYYSYFNNNKTNEQYMNRILRFSRILKNLLE